MQRVNYHLDTGDTTYTVVIDQPDAADAADARRRADIEIARIALPGTITAVEVDGQLDQVPLAQQETIVHITAGPLVSSPGHRSISVDDLLAENDGYEDDALRWVQSMLDHNEYDDSDGSQLISRYFPTNREVLQRQLVAWLAEPANVRRALRSTDADQLLAYVSAYATGERSGVLAINPATNTTLDGPHPNKGLAMQAAEAADPNSDWLLLPLYRAG